MQYFFILGRQPRLSADEIKIKISKIDSKSTLLKETEQFLIYQINKDMEPEKLNKLLAGTVKIGKIIKSTDNFDPKEIKALLPENKEKVIFGLSAYGHNYNINKIGLNIKKELKNQGQKARFVSAKAYPLSSVVVQKNILNKNGTELVSLKTAEQIFWGKTLSVQPFALFSKLDFGRPARDDYSGMLPPKLAQIMLNLSKAKPTDKILDPFCGSGTIIQQAYFLGFNQIIGSDTNPKAIKSCQQNLKWLADEFNLNIKPKILNLSAQNLSEKMENSAINIIVSEPDLGPPLKGRETSGQLKEIAERLESLYKKCFDSFNQILAQNGTIVFVFPEFKTKKGSIKLDLEKILKNNFELKKTWLYTRKDQHLARRICLIEKTP